MEVENRWFVEEASLPRFLLRPCYSFRVVLPGIMLQAITGYLATPLLVSRIQYAFYSRNSRMSLHVQLNLMQAYRTSPTSAEAKEASFSFSQ